jgi:hypothetical protein
MITPVLGIRFDHPWSILIRQPDLIQRSQHTLSGVGYWWIKGAQEMLYSGLNFNPDCQKPDPVSGFWGIRVCTAQKIGLYSIILPKYAI